MRNEKFVEYFLYALKNLRHRKTRTWLTMIGIFIGIATIVALISLGEGLQQTIDEQFEMLGTDKIIVYPGSNVFGTLTESAKPLTLNDLDVVKKTKGVEKAMGGLVSYGAIKYKDEIKYLPVYSLPTDEGRKLFEEIAGFDLQEGRGLKSGDKYKVVLGNYFIQEGRIFGSEISPGKKIFINDIEFDVIGVYTPIGNSQDDSNVIIPDEIAREIFGIENRVDYVYAQVLPGEDVALIAERVEDELRDFNNVEEGNEYFTVQTSLELMDSFNQIIGIVNAVLIGLAVISLIVGGIGIMNTMFTSVLQRTSEIGIMKSVGAKNSDVLWLFLIESGMLGLAGGTIGILLGLGISKLVSYAVFLSLGTNYLGAYVGWELILGALLFSFLIGTISGILPAIRASKMNPVDAISYRK